MFPSALRRNTGTGALQDLEQRLLHTLTRHIACDGGIVGLPGDLVHFINISYAGFCLLDVEVSGLDELEKDVLNVLPQKLQSSCSDPPDDSVTTNPLPVFYDLVDNPVA